MRLSHLGLYASLLTTLHATESKKESLAELRKKAGQLMWVGYHNLEQVADIQPAGIVFFGWNMTSTAEVKEAVKNIRDQEKAKGFERSFIALDHEGGRVIRLKKGLTIVPDAAALAASRDTELVEKISFLMARELKNIGVDINFAPVMDRGDARSFLENRVWGDDPETVTQMTSAFLEGHLKGGTFPLPKHFPGHGPQAFQDAHFLKAINYQSKEEIVKEDLPPFLHAMQDPRIPAMMTAHVEMMAFDRQPASLSKRVMSDFLRKELGYQGFLLSDDLEMGAVSDKDEKTQSYDVAETAVKSLKSGLDSVMIVWSLKDQKRVRDRIVKAIQNGELSEVELDEKIARVKMLREKIIALKLSSEKNPSFSFQQKKDLIEQAWFNSQTWILGTEASLGPLKASQRWSVVMPEGPYVSIWKSFRPNDKIVSFDPQKGEYAEILSFLSKKSLEKQPIVVITMPLHKDGGEWVKQLAKFFSSSYKSSNAISPFLWVHMGTLPVKVPRVEKPQKAFSMVLLNSSIPSSLRHFMRVLSFEHLSWNSVSPKLSSYSP